MKYGVEKEIILIPRGETFLQTPVCIYVQGFCRCSHSTDSHLEGWPRQFLHQHQ